MTPTVTLRKAGWTACYAHPVTGKRRQVVVESESDGWQLIQREARAAAQQQDKERRSETKQAPPAPTGGVTLDQAYKLSWQRRFKGQAQAERRVPCNWRRIRRYFGGNTQLASITSIWFQQWRDDMRDEGMKNTGINRVVATLAAMRADALLFGRVEDLPMWPGNLRVTKIPPRFLNQDEVNRMVAYWQDQGDQQMIDLFLVRIAEGCRWPEVQNLKPRDINVDADQVTFWKTKNGDARTVPLVGAAREILSRRAAAVGMDEPLFDYSYGQWNDRFKQCIDALRLPGRVVGHTCRHTMAARAVSANVSTQQLKHWGGWRSTASLEAYAHLDTQGLKVMQKALESYQ